MGLLIFEVPGPPHGKGRPRAARFAGGVRLYTDAATVAFEDRVALHATQAAGIVRPIEGPVRVEVCAYRARPKAPGVSHEARSGLMLGGARACSTKPDADNIAKSVLDGCSLAGLWRDDCQVVDLYVRTLWAREGELPRTVVTVEELT
jgi:Holliday junction resolvase RusA-like endonuclease